MPEEADNTPEWAGEIGTVASWEALRVLLGRMHVKAGKPSLRLMADRTEKLTGELKVYRTTKTTIGDVLKGTKKPKMNALLGLVCALGVKEQHWPLWREVWARLESSEMRSVGDDAIDAELAEARQEVERLRAANEEFRAKLLRVQDDHGRELRELEHHYAQVERGMRGKIEMLDLLRVAQAQEMERLRVVNETLQAKLSCVEDNHGRELLGVQDDHGHELLRVQGDHVRELLRVQDDHGRELRELEHGYAQVANGLRQEIKMLEREALRCTGQTFRLMRVAADAQAKSDDLAAKNTLMWEKTLVAQQSHHYAERRVESLEEEITELNSEIRRLNAELVEAVRADRDWAEARADFAEKQSGDVETTLEAPCAYFETTSSLPKLPELVETRLMHPIYPPKRWPPLR
ncbi:hypothetical protein [Sphaerisporangium corydalis]|uniref:Uncharacterized protein n=1 Tax=Sphaerisporangium corydalis TaxID=1441875 RepID=A0ABV9EG10_9ACTN|nr:hypothetical protein [Sphaerisporangium corydalis]